jgi:hypothetical protein
MSLSEIIDVIMISGIFSKKEDSLDILPPPPPFPEIDPEKRLKQAEKERNKQDKIRKKKESEEQIKEELRKKLDEEKKRAQENEKLREIEEKARIRQEEKERKKENKNKNKKKQARKSGISFQELLKKADLNVKKIRKNAEIKIIKKIPKVIPLPKNLLKKKSSSIAKHIGKVHDETKKGLIKVLHRAGILKTEKQKKEELEIKKERQSQKEEEQKRIDQEKKQSELLKNLEEEAKKAELEKKRNNEEELRKTEEKSRKKREEKERKKEEIRIRKEKEREKSRRQREKQNARRLEENRLKEQMHSEEIRRSEERKKRAEDFESKKKEERERIQKIGKIDENSQVKKEGLAIQPKENFVTKKDEAFAELDSIEEDLKIKPDNKLKSISKGIFKIFGKKEDEDIKDEIDDLEKDADIVENEIKKEEEQDKVYLAKSEDDDEKEIQKAISSIRKTKLAQKKITVSPERIKDEVEMPELVPRTYDKIDPVEEVEENIHRARMMIMDFKFDVAKKLYIEIMKIYNEMDPKDKVKVYEDIKDLYQERKSAERYADK